MLFQTYVYFYEFVIKLISFALLCYYDFFDDHYFTLIFCYLTTWNEKMVYSFIYTKLADGHSKCMKTYLS